MLSNDVHTYDVVLLTVVDVFRTFVGRFLRRPQTPVNALCIRRLVCTRTRTRLG